MNFSSSQEEAFVDAWAVKSYLADGQLLRKYLEFKT
ncbi:hypothetical protein SAMN06269250_3815 [Spirosoma fluviale]|uniref:Uncharacterized protein n=1 Tax=Spirosoma fluviale TaxID=1597977 RepID=A0A286GAF9_9BACT|nr:hypothetical protein SAMN06269250_3815 [Spirosoma fluviale]